MLTTMDYSVLRYDPDTKETWIVDPVPPMMIGQVRDVRHGILPHDIGNDDHIQYPYVNDMSIRWSEK